MKFFTIVKKQLALMLLLIMTLMTPAVLSAAECNHTNNVNGKCSCGKFVMYYTTNSINLPEWQGFENTTVNGKLAWVFSSSTIGNGKLQAVDGLVSVVIPEGITAIGDGAFARCKDLKTVVIPGTVKKIGGGAFQQCSSLTNLELGYGIEEISGGAFAQCTSLESLTIPGSVTSFGTNGTFGNGNLSDVEIEDGVKELGYIFQGCTSLKSIVIPGSVKNIPSGAFQNCSNLTSLVLGEGVESIGSGAFQGCTGIESLVIPGSIKNIQDNAFQNCTNLTSVEFGDGIAKIGNSAFQGCPIEEVVLPGSVNYIGWNAFDNYTSVNVTVGTDGKLPETNTKIDLLLNDNSSLESLMNAADNDKVASVTYTRTNMSSGTWGTICLPFDAQSDENVKFYQLGEVDFEKNVMTFEALEGVVAANTPCVIQKLSDTNNLEIRAAGMAHPAVDLTKNLGNDWSIIGTYEKTNVYVTEETPNLYYIASNKFKYAVEYFVLKPFRAYFKYDGFVSSAAASARFSVEVADEFATGINNASVEAQEEGVLYDLAGKRVEKMVNGQVYILNGQKVMFK